MISGVVLKRLTQDHEFKPFDCGNQDLNDFIPLEDDISDTDKTTVQLYFNLNRCLS